MPEFSDDTGRALSRLGRFEATALEGGGQETFDVEVARAGLVVVAADCDFGCEDLDLFLEDASGDLVARGRDPDPEPRLSVEVPAAGVYRVAVRMGHCIVEPCSFVASLFGSAPPDPSAGHAHDQGSCFAVHPEGLVATAAHVVDDAVSVRVHLADGTRVDAEAAALGTGYRCRRESSPSRPGRGGGWQHAQKGGTASRTQVVCEHARDRPTRIPREA